MVLSHNHVNDPHKQDKLNSRTTAHAGEAVRVTEEKKKKMLSDT